LTQDAVVDIVRNAVYTVILTSAPPLIMGLTVGIIVSIIQTITSIQEATLAFVPKILAVMVALVIFGYFMLSTLHDYIYNLIESIPTYL
jgi:flagellar biosynthetic protein FliQ